MSNDIHLRAILHEIPLPLITVISLKITEHNFILILPGATELNGPVWSKFNAVIYWDTKDLNIQRKNELVKVNWNKYQYMKNILKGQYAALSLWLISWMSYLQQIVFFYIKHIYWCDISFSLKLKFSWSVLFFSFFPNTFLPFYLDFFSALQSLMIWHHGLYRLLGLVTMGCVIIRG